MTSTASSRLTATKATSGASGSASTERTQAIPASSARLGWTAKISPGKARPRVCRIATSHSAPPMKASEPGESSRESRVVIDFGTTSSTQRPQQRARYDVALDLARSLPDALDAGIAPDALQREVVHEAHAAMNLDCLVGDHGQHLGGLQLGHRHVHVLDRALVIFPRRLQREQPGGLHFNRHIGELKGNPLELADLLAELRTVDCPLLGVDKCALGTADAGRRNLKPRSAEPLIGDVEAFVNLAEHGAGGNAAVGEFEN